MPRKTGKKNSSNGDNGNDSPVINFTEEELKYKPDEFLCPGSDDHGQSVRVTFRCPPIMERQLEIIRDDKQLPYKTISDVVRHAVYRHMQWIQVKKPDMPKHMLAGLDAVLLVCRDAEMRSRVEQTFVQLDRLIDEALGRDDQPEAMRLMTLSKQQIIAMPDGRWKQNWMDRFNRKYSHYLTIPEPPTPVPPLFPMPELPPEKEGED